MSGEWFSKSGRTLERRQNSTNGNPRYWVTFADGTRLPTATDASVGYVIGNSEFDGAVRVWVVRGHITDIVAVTE